MSSGLIELVGADILASIEGGGDEARFSAEPAIAKLQAWSKRYDKASQLDNEGELSKIGREMFAWLDESGWASAWALGSGDRSLEIRVKGAGGAEEEALLDAPWELLSRPTGRRSPSTKSSRSSSCAASAKRGAARPRHGDLQLMFMAAALEWQHEIDYEAEETAILEATRSLPMRVVVEETGTLEFLRRDWIRSRDPSRPCIFPVTATSTRRRGRSCCSRPPRAARTASAQARCCANWGTSRRRWWCCRPAARPSAAARVPAPGYTGRREGMGSDARRDAGEASGHRSGPELATPFVRRLAAKIANVVGWDGSV